MLHWCFTRASFWRSRGRAGDMMEMGKGISQCGQFGVDAIFSNSSWHASLVSGLCQLKKCYRFEKTMVEKSIVNRTWAYFLFPLWQSPTHGICQTSPWCSCISRRKRIILGPKINTSSITILQSLVNINLCWGILFTTLIWVAKHWLFIQYTWMFKPQTCDCGLSCWIACDQCRPSGATSNLVLAI